MQTIIKNTIIDTEILRFKTVMAKVGLNWDETNQIYFQKLTSIESFVQKRYVSVYSEMNFRWFCKENFDFEDSFRVYRRDEAPRLRYFNFIFIR